MCELQPCCALHLLKTFKKVNLCLYTLHHRSRSLSRLFILKKTDIHLYLLEGGCCAVNDPEKKSRKWVAKRQQCGSSAGGGARREGDDRKGWMNGNHERLRRKRKSRESGKKTRRKSQEARKNLSLSKMLRSIGVKNTGENVRLFFPRKARGRLRDCVMTKKTRTKEHARRSHNCHDEEECERNGRRRAWRIEITVATETRILGTDINANRSTRANF